MYDHIALEVCYDSQAMRVAKYIYIRENLRHGMGNQSPLGQHGFMSLTDVISNYVNNVICL